jgi:hypothetical protein
MKVYFQTGKHIFLAHVEDRPYGKFIHIGGSQFTKCLEITISAAAEGHILQIKGEPECGVNALLEDGDMVPMIKAALQFCSTVIPELKTYRLTDDSHIECGKKSPPPPPRKLNKPFSLSHFHLAKYGKTWYEDKFGARLSNPKKYEAYRAATKVLAEPKGKPFEWFAKKTGISQEQIDMLKGPYEKTTTWHEFFLSIGKDARCAAFFNWLPFFIEDLLHGEFNNTGWIINIDTMPKVEMTILDGPPPGQRGGTRKRKGRVTFTSYNPYGFSNND